VDITRQTSNYGDKMNPGASEIRERFIGSHSA